MGKSIEYTKLDETRLEETTELKYGTTLHRIYDFDAEQVLSVTTLEYDRSYQAAGGGATMLSHSFNEVGTRRLQKAHAELIQQGGNPPPLDDSLLGNSRKKTVRIDA